METVKPNKIMFNISLVLGAFHKDPLAHQHNSICSQRNLEVKRNIDCFTKLPISVYSKNGISNKGLKGLLIINSIPWVGCYINSCYLKVNIKKASWRNWATLSGRTFSIVFGENTIFWSFFTGPMNVRYI